MIHLAVAGCGFLFHDHDAEVKPASSRPSTVSKQFVMNHTSQEAQTTTKTSFFKVAAVATVRDAGDAVQSTHLS